MSELGKLPRGVGGLVAVGARVIGCDQCEWGKTNVTRPLGEVLKGALERSSVDTDADERDGTEAVLDGLEESSPVRDCGGGLCGSIVDTRAHRKVLN
jgi:hypothetical protein